MGLFRELGFGEKKIIVYLSMRGHDLLGNHLNDLDLLFR